VEGILGPLAGGALWGLGAGVVLGAWRGTGTGLRPVAKSAIKAYLAAAERVRETAAEAREGLDDLYAEARAERRRPAAARRAAQRPAATTTPSAPSARPATAARTAGRSGGATRSSRSATSRSGRARSTGAAGQGAAATTATTPTQSAQPAADGRVAP
jgi:Protein of unknown function (DUF5132)